MEIKAIKCPQCGASSQNDIKVINENNIMIGECSHCKTKFIINDLKKEIVLEEKKEIPKEIPRVVEEVKEEKPVAFEEANGEIELLDNKCSLFKSPAMKRRAMAFAIVVAMSLSFIGANSANRKEVVEPNYEYIETVVSQVRDDLIDKKISREEAIKKLNEVGVEVSPFYFEEIDYARMEQEKVEADMDLTLQEEQAILEKSKSMH